MRLQKQNVALQKQLSTATGARAAAERSLAKLEKGRDDLSAKAEKRASTAEAEQAKLAKQLRFTPMFDVFDAMA